MIPDIFLTLEECLPLAVFVADNSGFKSVDFDDFLESSLIGMSKEQGNRYADRLEVYVSQLRDCK